MPVLRILSLMIILLGYFSVQAQDQGLMYGKVTTLTGATYQGNIRWGGEEVFWTDVFNASKLDTRVFGHMLKNQEIENEDESWLGIDWSFSSIWEDYRSGSVHEFSSMFGNFKALEYRRDNRAIITLRNGAKIVVGGSGYNDIKASVMVYDDELGEIKIRGSNVDKVEFMRTPSRLRAKFGEPLYGSLITYEGDSITGFIQWDHDERLSTDILNGSTSSETVKIPMGQIVRIEPGRGSSQVKLISGVEFNMSGTNDVNQGNRGVIVTVEGLGRVDVSWSDIDYVSFDASKKGNAVSYDNFRSLDILKGTVILLNERKYSGFFAYDMDEVWNFEFLDGESDGMEVKIPFSNIKSIRPKNAKYSLIRFKNGNKMLVGNSRDVSSSNGGILLFADKNKDPVSIDWDDVDEIIFD